MMDDWQDETQRGEGSEGEAEEDALEGGDGRGEEPVRERGERLAGQRASH